MLILVNLFRRINEDLIRQGSRRRQAERTKSSCYIDEVSSIQLSLCESTKFHKVTVEWSCIAFQLSLLFNSTSIRNLSCQLNLADSTVLFIPIFTLFCLPFPAHPAGFSFSFFTDFLPIFIVLSPNNNFNNENDGTHL